MWIIVIIIMIVNSIFFSTQRNKKEEEASHWMDYSDNCAISEDMNNNSHLNIQVAIH